MPDILWYICIIQYMYYIAIYKQTFMFSCLKKLARILEVIFQKYAWNHINQDACCRIGVIFHHLLAAIPSVRSFKLSQVVNIYRSTFTHYRKMKLAELWTLIRLKLVHEPDTHINQPSPSKYMNG